MKVDCVKEKLNSAVSLAEKITSKNSTLPVLKCLLLEASSNNLIIRATNLDLGIEIKIPTKILKEGRIAISGSILNSFLSNIIEKNIQLQKNEGNLKVISSKNNTIIKAYPDDDFPSIPKIEDGKKINFNTRDFINGLKSVWYSSSVSSMKPELSSIFIYSEDDCLVFVATDSFRLAEKRIKLKKRDTIPSILIPFKNIPDIIRVLEQSSSDEVLITVNKNQLSFESENIYLFSRIVEGIFPDYKQIIPKESDTEAIILKEDLVNSIKLANIFSDQFNQINIKLSPKDKVLKLVTKNNEIGENQHTLDAAISGNDIDISFNHKYINDCFQSLDSDSLSLNFNGPNKPVLIKGVGDKSFLYIVSPMNK